ncbi:MAG: hypothetical protein ACJ8H8_34405, partial [Geminicoccaceae bacterium]
MAIASDFDVRAKLTLGSVGREHPGRIQIGAAQVVWWLAVITAAVVGACVLVTSMTIILHAPTMNG